MAKISFDIKYRPQIETGEYKVETGDKKRVRIICWNRKVNDFPIVALAYDAQKDAEIFINASVLGEPHTNIASDRLFIVTPEEEMSEFEMAIHRRLNLMNGENLSATDLLEETKGMAAELFELAKDEIYNHESLVEYAKKAKAKGKAEALKDLPRWKRLYSKENSDKIPDCIIPGKALDNRLVHRGFELKITDLEKLPGFKEDGHE